MREVMWAEEPFVKIPECLLEATHFVGAGGETLPLTPNDKVLFAYMYKRWRYFKEERGGSYYDTQEDISIKLGMSRATVNSSVRKFRDAGVFITRDVHGIGWSSIEYVRIAPPKLLSRYGEKKEPANSASSYLGDSPF